MTSAAALYSEAFDQGLRPDPRLTVSEWADTHRRLSPRASSEPGPWRTSRTPYLKEIMDCLSAGSPVERVVVMKGAQVGAPLALDTPIPTAAGWKTMGSLLVGDTVFDQRGRTCHVTGVSPVMIGQPCYEIAFDDSETIVCDASHRWPVWDFTDNENPKAKVLRTDEMLGRVRIGRSKRYRFAVDCCEALDLPEQDLVIHPYVLGLWLGDGSSVMNHVSVHEDDGEVIEHLRACGVEAEFRLPRWRKGKCANVVIDPTFRTIDDAGLPASVQHRSRFTTRLRQLDVLDNKHIPAPYLRASRAQRLDLVRGLMDSDGTITPDGKRCEFSNADRKLVGNFVELLRSLGYKPTVYKVESRRRAIGDREHDCLAYWRVSWTAYREEPMFRLSRKVARMRSIEGGRPSRSRRRRIVAITPVASRPVRCIAVDSPSHLYLCGRGLIPTHNTEAGNNWIGYVVHHAPGPMLAVLPTVEMAKRNSRQRIDPLIEESPALRERIAPSRARDSGNTVLAKEFRGGVLVMTGANSAVGLRSMPVRYLFLDEVDGYPGDVDGEGDPIALAEARTRTFARRKILVISTPTIAGLSRIEREYAHSDQRRFFVPCPRCEAMQWLKFERLRWPKGKPDAAAYHCEDCEREIAEHHKTRMLAGGEWRATATGPADPRTAGFHLSSLYSPLGWRSWAEIAAAWETAQGSDAALKSFRNTELGETWTESGDAPDWQRLYERREEFSLGTVSLGALFLTAGADVQKDRIEVSVWAWGRGLTSWLVDHIVIDGGPESAEAWERLTALLGQTWPHASGARLGLAKLGIDTGYEAPAVYAWSRKAGYAQVAPLKGVEGFHRAAPVVGPSYVDLTEGGKKLRRGARLWTVAVATFKSETYRFLRLVRPTDEEIAGGATDPLGYVHLPRGTEAEWLRQLTAEQLVSVKTRRGFQRLEWQKIRERNEALDCRVYARAAAWIVGADRWGEARWRDLEAQLATRDVRDEAGSAENTEPQTPSAGRVRAPIRQGRRVFRSSYLT